MLGKNTYLNCIGRNKLRILLSEEVMSRLGKIQLKMRL